MHGLSHFQMTTCQVDSTPMPKYTSKNMANFGKHLAQLRKDAGYTQQELADEIESSRRVIAYYETESTHPPANLLVDLAKALNITTDELLGVKPIKQKAESRKQLNQITVYSVVFSR